jgi:hypothetical protein
MIPAVEIYLRMVLNYALDVPQGEVPFYLTLQEQSSGYNKLILPFDMCIQQFSFR